MGDSVIKLTKNQVRQILNWPKELEVSKERATRIVAATMEAWSNGKPSPEEVVKVMKIPGSMKVSQRIISRIGYAVIETAGISDGKAKMKLTRRQVFSAVAQLNLQDKRELKEKLDHELQKVQKDVTIAIKGIRKAYENVSEDEIEKDVASAIAEGRRIYRAESRP